MYNVPYDYHEFSINVDIWRMTLMNVTFSALLKRPCSMLTEDGDIPSWSRLAMVPPWVQQQFPYRKILHSHWKKPWKEWLLCVGKLHRFILPQMSTMSNEQIRNQLVKHLRTTPLTSKKDMNPLKHKKKHANIIWTYDQHHSSSFPAMALLNWSDLAQRHSTTLWNVSLLWPCWASWHWMLGSLETSFAVQRKHIWRIAMSWCWSFWILTHQKQVETTHCWELDGGPLGHEAWTSKVTAVHGQSASLPSSPWCHRPGWCESTSLHNFHTIHWCPLGTLIVKSWLVWQDLQATTNPFSSQPLREVSYIILWADWNPNEKPVDVGESLVDISRQKS